MEVEVGTDRVVNMCRSVLDVHSDHARRAAEKSHVAWSGAQVPLERGKRAYPITFDDPLFSQQWFLVH